MRQFIQRAAQGCGAIALLAAFSAGSIVGGLAYGARSWRSRLDVRLLGCVIALAVLSFGPVAAPSIVVIAPALNEADIEDIPQHLRRQIHFVFVSDVSEVLDAALATRRSRAYALA